MLKALLFVGLLILSAWPETVVAQERYLASYNVIATRRSFLEKNRGVVKRFLQAYSEGLYQFITNREKALAITNQRLKQKNTALVEEAYQYYAPIFSFPPRVSREGLRVVLEALRSEPPERRLR